MATTVTHASSTNGQLDTPAEHARALAEALERLAAADADATRLVESFLDRCVDEGFADALGAAVYAHAESIRDELDGENDYDPSRWVEKGRALCEL